MGFPRAGKSHFLLKNRALSIMYIGFKDKSGCGGGADQGLRSPPDPEKGRPCFRLFPESFEANQGKGKDAVMTLTKAHIVEKLFAENLFTKAESAQIVETLFEIVKQTLEGGEDVLISGFGKFSVKEKNQRRGRNPQTGEPILLAPRRVVTFKCSGVLRDKINAGD
jgi:integration host factor subunit alpha